MSLRPARCLLALALGVAVLVAAGCGGDEPEPRPRVPARLAVLCDETRVAVEALGAPQDRGAAVFRPWARLGRAFVADVRRVRGQTVRQRAQLVRLADYFKGFYDNLQIGYELFEAGRSTAIKPVIERAYALLQSAEELAVRLGAPECAVRPFEGD